MAESVSRREFLRAPWRALAAERPVGRITIDPQRCTLCGACAERCPQGALVLEGALINCGLRSMELYARRVGCVSSARSRRCI
jgi:formate hydrogenlyase subunit 6/NADH:ubiquinone oxidoreductase subunit I